LELATTTNGDLTFAKDMETISSSQRLDTATIIDTVSDEGFDSVMEIQNALDEGLESFPTECSANDLTCFKSIDEALGEGMGNFPIE
jgi:hypothetical protein